MMKYFPWIVAFLGVACLTLFIIDLSFFPASCLGMVILVCLGVWKQRWKPGFLLAALSPYLLFCVLWLNALGWNPNGFIIFGTTFIHDASMLPDPWQTRMTNEIGYDGQWFYYLATDPLVRGTTAKNLDVPAYRAGRILYPLLAKTLSLNRKNLIPWSLIVVNLFSIGALALLLHAFCRHAKISPVWGLFASWNVALMHALRYSLSEPLYILCLIFACYAWLVLKKNHWVALGLAACVLTRELGLLLVLGWIIVAWKEKDKPRMALGTVPIAVYGLWQVYLYLTLHHFSFTMVRGNFGLPFSGFLHMLTTSCAPPAHQLLLLYPFHHLVALGVMGGIVLAGLYHVFHHFRHPLAPSLFFYCCLPVFAGEQIWCGGTFDRVFVDAWMLTVLMIFYRPTRGGKAWILLGSLFAFLPLITFFFFT